MATNYQRGAALENWVVDRMRAAGLVATRTAGSHGEADVWAAGLLSAPVAGPEGVRQGLLLIQCKSGASSLPGVEEWNGLVQAAAIAGAVPILAHRVKKGSPKVDWWKLTGPKVIPGQRRKNWPWEPWTPPPEVN